MRLPYNKAYTDIAATLLPGVSFPLSRTDVRVHGEPRVLQTRFDARTILSHEVDRGPCDKGYKASILRSLRADHGRRATRVMAFRCEDVTAFSIFPFFFFLRLSPRTSVHHGDIPVAVEERRFFDEQFVGTMTIELLMKLRKSIVDKLLLVFVYSLCCGIMLIIGVLTSRIRRIRSPP